MMGAVSRMPSPATAAGYHPRMIPVPRSVADLLGQARRRIDPAEADLLLAHALGRSRAWLLAHAGDDIAAPDAARFEALAERRLAGEPVAYLTGSRGFWTLDLAVTPATLVPRPETELVVELALARIPADADADVADLGTGSGAIALAIAKERPRARVVATDASAEALQVARGNAPRNGIDNVEFRHGDWFVPLAGVSFDLVAGNPPYIALGDPHLQEGDLRFEPASALSSGSDGLDAIRAIVRAAPAHLRAGGWLLLEHGLGQGEAVRALLRTAGLDDVATECDLEGRDRVTLGRFP
jgi:release factor glutamine methyltransferase